MAKANKHSVHSSPNIRLRKDGRWEARSPYPQDIQSGRHRLQSIYGNTKAEVWDKLQAHNVTQARHYRTIRFGQWYEFWVEHYKRNQISFSGYHQYKSFLRNHFFCFAHISLAELSTELLQCFLNYKLTEEKLCVNYVRTLFKALNACLRQAVVDEKSEVNSCEHIVLPPAETAEIKILTKSQQQAVMAASYQNYYGVFIRLALCTGLRIGELAALQWEDIDLQAKTLSVKRTLRTHKANGNHPDILFAPPKTKHSRRVIPLTSGAVQDLQNWRNAQVRSLLENPLKYKDHGFLVTDPTGNLLGFYKLRQQYQNILREAEIAAVTFHALRHSFATRALENGMDYKTLSVILGHFSVAFTMDTYVHCPSQHRRNEMARMEFIYDEAYNAEANTSLRALYKITADSCILLVPQRCICIQATDLQSALAKTQTQLREEKSSHSMHMPEAKPFAQVPDEWREISISLPQYPRSQKTPENTYAACLERLAQYPDVLSLEQFRLVCRIGKATARAILASGDIAYAYNGKKTHCYAISKSNVLRYLKQRWKVASVNT